MKSILVFIVSLFLIIDLHAQDTLQVTTEVDTAFVPPQYVSNIGEHYINELPIQKGFKIGVLGNLFNTGFLTYHNVFFLYERKIRANISINGGIIMNRAFSYPLNVLPENNTFSTTKQIYSRGSIALILEPRLYLKAKNKVNNLNGTYISFKSDVTIPFQRVNLSLNYGLQRQVLQNGLTFRRSQYYPSIMDMQLGLGIVMNKDKSLQPLLHYGIYYGGLSSRLFGKRQDNELLPSSQDMQQGEGIIIEQSKIAHLARYLNDKKYSIRLDLINFFNYYNRSDYMLNTGIAFERAINKSAFSINTDWTIQWGRLPNTVAKQGYLNSTSLQILLEPRYFYNKKRGATLDITSNALSGAFGALQLAYVQNNLAEKLPLTTEKKYIQRQYISLQGVWGTQTQLLKNIFFEAKLGLGVKKGLSQSLPDYQKYSVTYSTIYKVGLCF